MLKSLHLSNAVVASLFGSFAWAASLAVPHPVAPDELPAPQIDFEAARSAQQTESARAARARQAPLSYAVRAVGELVRRVGISEHRRDSQETNLLRGQLRNALRGAVDPDELLSLRALQTELFLAAFDRQLRTHSVPFDAELLELGGSFAEHADQQQWWTDPRQLPERSELTAVYRIRWNELVGVANVPRFQVSANDRRLDFRMRLRGFRNLPSPDRGNAELAVLKALTPFDPGYPATYAQGIALIHAGSYKPAFDVLQSYLATNPSGEFALRARNFALYAALELSN
jgi:TolA-binding protein